MSQTANALLFKFLMTLIVAWLAFGVFGRNALEWILMIAVLGAVIDYLVGDLLILPKVGSFVGAIINAGLAALLAVVLAMIIPAFSITTITVLIFAVLIGVGEYFFHQYLLKADKVEP